jgi:hypothetical protein
VSSLEKIALAAVTGIVGVAVLATLVSRQSKSPQVINATGKALSGSLSAAEGR